MIVFMPGGEIEYFRAENENGSVVWKNNNDTWVGVPGTNWGDFTITRWDGWEIEFRGSFIYRLTTDQGRILRWTYDSTNPGLATGIYEPGNAPVVNLALSSDVLVMQGSSTTRGAYQLEVNGDTYTFSYNNGTLKDIEFPDGRKIQWHFEELPDTITSRLTLTQENGWWRSWVYYNSARRVITDDHWNYEITGGDPNENGLVYDRPDQRRTRIATGEYETWKYTASNSIHTKRDFLGNETITYRYKTPGRLYNRVFKVERKPAGQSSTSVVWRGVHDAATGDLLSSFDAFNNQTTYTYERFTGASEFQPPKKVAITDPLGRVSTLERDLQANIIEVVDASGVKRKMEYDSRNRLIRIKNAANDALARFVYGDKDEVLDSFDSAENKTTFEYDIVLGVALLKKITTPENRVVTFTRDSLGRMTRMKMPSHAEWNYTHVDDWDVVETARDPLNNQTTYEYDARLNRIKTTDPLNRIVETVFDDLDLPAEVSNALGQVTTFQNNAYGDLTELTDAREKTYTLAWETSGERKSLEWPDEAKQTNVFDANGRLSQWKSRGDFGTINISRNSAGEITGTSWTAGGESGTTTFTWNAAGQVSGTSAATMALSVDHSLAYDSEGRLSVLTQTVGSVERSAAVAYDLEGRISTLTYPQGFTVSYHYNKDAQIEMIKKGTTTIASYGYDSGGRLCTRTLSNGVVTTYTYDGAERVDSITVSLGSTVLWAERYGYNAAGERIYTLHGDTGTVGDAYWLDAASQLRGVKYGVANATGSYGGISASVYSEWNYDETGNRISETGSSGTTNYNRNDINQYTAVSGVPTIGYSARGDLTAFGDWSYTYDAAGNLIRAHNSQSNRLVKYWRDASGHRAVKDVDGEKTVFFNLGTDQLEAYDITTEMASSTIYQPGIDVPLAEINNDGSIRFFYHQDWLGNVALLTDAAGARLQTYTYGVWGEPSGFDSSGLSLPVSGFESRFLFTAREYDQETGLYHYRARGYSPALGRFLQTDPIDFAGGDVNLFRYVSNNPVNWMDPLGLLPADAIPIDGNAKYPWSPAAVPLVTDVINDSLLGQKGEHEEGITVFFKDDQYYYKRGITCPEKTGSVQNFERDPDAIWDLHTHPNNSRGMNPFGPDAKYTQSTPYVVDSWNLFRMNPPGVHPIGFTFPKHPSHWWPDAKFGNK